MDNFDLIIKLAIGVTTATLIWALHYPLRRFSINGDALETRMIMYEVRWKWPKWIRAIVMLSFFPISLAYQFLLLIIWAKFTLYISDLILAYG